MTENKENTRIGTLKNINHIKNKKLINKRTMNRQMNHLKLILKAKKMNNNKWKKGENSDKSY